MSYKLGILDQSPIYPNTTASEALQETIKLAKLAEEWGYERFWVSEHHHTDQLAGASPEVLISHLLAQTKTIRIGSGGVLLQHYSPYKVVENFHVLSNLAPGRVDLGIGKSPGGLPLSTRALQYGTLNDGKDFDERFSLLKKLIANIVEDSHSLAGIKATPLPSIPPETYLLGASKESAKLAATYETSFVYGNFFNSNPSDLEEAARLYRSVFPTGRFILGVAVIAHPSKEIAEQLAENFKKLVLVHLKSGRTVKVGTREQAELFGNQSGELFEIEEQETDIIAGTPSFVKEALNDLYQKYDVDEFILHTPILKEKERVQSFELLSPLDVSISNV
ncbi:LLM class flavin-dependent oxidoreductase [Robertmurraya korlensis]|uniref:LLM class flavin-dependent oxidoreductase n=1 Tax=Robertmurraya korlensis TaxID=519977 RepID=UPI00204106B8|nr:LLM class flavin-dependent oxidoreductase [Robertmurraya korlensis]MCM3601182.1 LLM class flavin-dependent oxidoreductase [Robertmurraya korlensis]